MMSFRNYLAAGLILCLAGCSSSITQEEPIVYNYPKHQLPNEPRYGTTAWVPPPTVIPGDSDQSGFSAGEAPLLKPVDGVARGASPRLPSAQSRRY